MTTPTDAVAIAHDVLEPCPFCGSEVGVHLTTTRIDAETIWSGVECHGCGAQVSPHNSSAEAIAAWNMRATPDPAKPRDVGEIVAWLREQERLGEVACLLADNGGRRERDIAAGVVALKRAADAIERGDYRPVPTPQDEEQG